ncbi:hypothetical protein CAP36_15385 [Chitinophagaceae bacterium IBVUCB2]|nr:hypothetical protein CAP36_15385 [Chitinophagaceae bacterium IBVUCB2]
MRLYTYLELNELALANSAVMSKFSFFEHFALTHENLNSLLHYFHENGFSNISSGGGLEFSKMFDDYVEIRATLSRIADAYYRFLINYTWTNVYSLIAKENKNNFCFITRVALCLYYPDFRNKLISGDDAGLIISLLALINEKQVYNDSISPGYKYIRLKVIDKIYSNPDDIHEQPIVLWGITIAEDPIALLRETFDSNKMYIDDESNSSLTGYSFDHYIITDNPDLLFLRPVILYPSLKELKCLYSFKEIEVYVHKIWSGDYESANQSWDNSKLFWHYTAQTVRK